MDDAIIVYADGAVIDNGSAKSRCGWAVKLMYKGAVRVKSGKANGYTNNQMKMMALFKAMQSITDKTIPVVVYSDSQYVIKTINCEFRVGANEAMWKQLFSERDKFLNIKFFWVKGHANNPHNIEVDALSFKEASNA